MWPNPQFPADLVTSTEEILNGKLNFLCSVNSTSVFKMFTNTEFHVRRFPYMRSSTNSAFNIKWT